MVRQLLTVAYIISLILAVVASLMAFTRATNALGGAQRQYGQTLQTWAEVGIRPADAARLLIARAALDAAVGPPAWLWLTAAIIGTGASIGSLYVT